MIRSLQFLMYINYLVDLGSQSMSIRLLADGCIDFKEIIAAKDQAVLQTCIVEIERRCNKRGMDLNMNKTVLLLITWKNQIS